MRRFATLPALLRARFFQVNRLKHDHSLLPQKLVVPPLLVGKSVALQPALAAARRSPSCYQPWAVIKMALPFCPAGRDRSILSPAGGRLAAGLSLIGLPSLESHRQVPSPHRRRKALRHRRELDEAQRHRHRRRHCRRTRPTDGAIFTTFATAAIFATAALAASVATFSTAALAAALTPPLGAAGLRYVLQRRTPRGKCTRRMGGTSSAAWAPAGHTSCRIAPTAPGGRLLP